MSFSLEQALIRALNALTKYVEWKTAPELRRTNA